MQPRLPADYADSMRVLGVDPGLRITGYGCVESRAAADAPALLVEAGALRLSRRDADLGGAASVSHRLCELHAAFAELLDRLQPAAVAVEGLFAHADFPGSALVMAHARGVLLLEVARRRLTLVELKPKLVKKTMTGSGRASKAQMQRAVQQYFALPALPTPHDVADALAIALCAREQRVLTLSIAAGLEEDVLASDIAEGLRRRARRSPKRTLPKDILER